ARRLARGRVSVRAGATTLGYGGAINAAGKATNTPFVAALNDDAFPHPEWLESMVDVMGKSPRTGMCAPCVRQEGTGLVDSAGMLLCADGSSKQRGQGEPVASYQRPEEVLLASGSAALYRRTMLDEVGWFDEDFFLYCEDTDLGLRARWAGWNCLYVPAAVVDHRYSHTSGRSSAAKAYLVERNRLRVLVKNFPARLLVAAPLVTAARYFWHGVSALMGRGAAGEFRKQGASPLVLAKFAVQAHASLLSHLGVLCRQRRAIRRAARITAAEFSLLVRRHQISARKVASL
ncbi:MAG: glycosyltransferase family 2 protein, partial [Acidobacteriia bacterium]|nr:glycosyltransferase family 2 protein [Terriglobia bacterium]